MDQLMSGEELLTISEENNRNRERHFRDLVFGLLDLSAAMLVFLPFFGETAEEGIRSVSLVSLTGMTPYLTVGYYLAVTGVIAVGILTLALQNCEKAAWVRNKTGISLFVNTVGAFLFVISRQPYAATFLLMFLTIKVFMLLKRR